MDVTFNAKKSKFIFYTETGNTHNDEADSISLAIFRMDGNVSEYFCS
jgi:hypothetical protein